METYLWRDRLEPGKEPQLKVTVGEKPQTDLYLYGYIGADYNRKQWERMESSARDQLGRREVLEERKGDVYRWLKKKKDEKNYLWSMRIQRRHMNIFHMEARSEMSRKYGEIPM